LSAVQRKRLGFVPGDVKGLQVLNERSPPRQPWPAAAAAALRWDPSKCLVGEAVVAHSDYVSSEAEASAGDEDVKGGQPAASKYLLVGDVVEVSDAQYPAEAALVKDVHSPVDAG
jgi:hypothetical protein